VRRFNLFSDCFQEVFRVIHDNEVFCGIVFIFGSRIFTELDQYPMRSLLSWRPTAAWQYLKVHLALAGQHR